MRSNVGLCFLAIVALIHCGGGSAENTQTTAPTASTTATPPPSASATTAAAPSIHCPAPGTTAATTPPATAKTGCPDMSTFETLAKLDLSKELKIDKKLAGQLKDVALVSVAFNRTATRIDAAMKDSCNKLLADLGCPGDFGDLQATCHAAENVIDQARATVGKDATLTPHITPPVCKAPAQAMLDCLHTCDPTFKGKVDALKCDGTGDATGCDGMWTADKTSRGCAIACAAEAGAKVQCTPEQLTVQIDGATDAAAAAKLKAALEKDLHGVMIQEAARGPIDKLAKKAAELLNALPKDLDMMAKQNPKLDCFDPAATNGVMAMTQIALETTLSLNVMMGATMPKK